MSVPTQPRESGGRRPHDRVSIFLLCVIVAMFTAGGVGAAYDGIWLVAAFLWFVALTFAWQGSA